MTVVTDGSINDNSYDNNNGNSVSSKNNEIIVIVIISILIIIVKIIITAVFTYWEFFLGGNNIISIFDFIYWFIMYLYFSFHSVKYERTKRAKESHKR